MTDAEFELLAATARAAQTLLWRENIGGELRQSLAVKIERAEAERRRRPYEPPGGPPPDRMP